MLYSIFCTLLQVKNVLISVFPAAAIPMHFPTDREVLDIALASLGLIGPSEARVLWIKNTLDLGEVEASVAYLSAARERADLDVLCDPRPLEVEPDGNLPPFEAFGRTGRGSSDDRD